MVIRNKHIFSIVMSLTVLSYASTPAVAQTNDLATRIAVVQTGLQTSLEKFRNQMQSANPTPTARDLSNAALFVLISKQDSKEAEDYLRRAFSTQNMETSSADFGQIPWQNGHPEIIDANSDEFTNQAVGSILIAYKEKLSADFQTWWQPHLAAALSILERRNVPVSYTNIYLMQTVDLILMGQALDDSTAMQEGTHHLDNWIAYTAANGIHEFDSPVYYAADLDSLIPGYLYSVDPTIKAKMKHILDYFWTDLTANYFAGRESLSGPHSRDYDFLEGIGGIKLYYYVEGVIPALQVGALDFEKTYLLEQSNPNAYHPDAAILALDHQTERWITQRYGDLPGQDRTNYVTPDFAIGVASGHYGPQDKLINAELAVGSDTPAITLVPDAYDAPWGKLMAKDVSGHDKPNHLRLDSAAVQDRGVLLVLLSLELSGKKAGDDLGTNLVLPSHVHQIRVNDQIIDAAKPFRQLVDAESTISIINGHGAVAIRFFQWEDCAPSNSQTVLQADVASLRYGALRLTHYHGCQSLTGKGARRLRVGMLILARHVDSTDQFQQLITDIQDAKIDAKINGSHWSVSATLDGTTFAVTQDSKNGALESRYINGHEVAIPVLAINGLNQILRLG